MIDTHAHIYSETLADDIDDIIARARSAGIKKIYMPNIDMDSIEAMLQLESQYSGYCVPMMGIHPCHINSEYASYLKAVETWFGRKHFAAVGETGIDLYWDKTYILEQKKSFAIHLEWAKDLRLPVVIHSRDSLEITMEMVKIHQDGRLNGVFHCFSGTLEDVNKIADLGFLVGIGGVVTFKNGGLDAVLPHIPADMILLETDSPYLAPAPFRGQRNEPSYLTHIAEKAAQYCGLTMNEIIDITTLNAQNLFID